MANEEHVALIKQGVDAWNAWRRENPDVRPNLSGADLSGADLTEEVLTEEVLAETVLHGADLGGADLGEVYRIKDNPGGANLSGANLSGADLIKANLSGANLSGANLNGTNLTEAVLIAANMTEAFLITANLSGANLNGANLIKANLSGANLSGANLIKANLIATSLSRANLSGANLSGAFLSGATLRQTNLIKANLGEANLSGANLIKANLGGANLSGCRIYGVSAWGLKLDGAKQQNLVITAPGEPEITVDNIEVAQFIYLLLHNEKIRDVIDTIGKKGVLLLGRFTEGRITILERLRNELRSRGYVPMVFNFDKPETKDFTETVRLLASLSQFVIVDISNPRSAPLELQATVPDLMVPFVPILEDGQDPFAMFVDLQNKYDWVLKPVIGYTSVDRLIDVLEDKVVRRAEAKFNELLEPV